MSGYGGAREGRGGAAGEGADHDGDKSKLVINLHKLMSVY
jgi:hypothetical protein